jgi:hypothetical protein
VLDFESKVQVSQIVQILSARKCSSLVDVQTLITPKPLSVSGRPDNRWKEEWYSITFVLGSWSDSNHVSPRFGIPDRCLQSSQIQHRYEEFQFVA